MFIVNKTPSDDSLLLRRFVFRMAGASAKRVTDDEPQGTMGRVETADLMTENFLVLLYVRPEYEARHQIKA